MTGPGCTCGIIGIGAQHASTCPLFWSAAPAPGTPAPCDHFSVETYRDGHKRCASCGALWYGEETGGWRPGAAPGTPARTPTPFATLIRECVEGWAKRGGYTVSVSDLLTDLAAVEAAHRAEVEEQRAAANVHHLAAGEAVTRMRAAKRALAEARAEVAQRDQQIHMLQVSLAEARDEVARLRAPRWFPIQTQRGAAPHPLRIPWSVAEKAYSVYAADYGRSQSLERLAERGGFGPSEMDMFLPGWREEVSEIAASRAEVERLQTAITEALTVRTLNSTLEAEVERLRVEIEAANARIHQLENMLEEK